MSTFEFDDRIGGRLRGTLHVPGATPGDVVTVGANGALSPSPGGGSQPSYLATLSAADIAAGAVVQIAPPPAANAFLIPQALLFVSRFATTPYTGGADYRLLIGNLVDVVIPAIPAALSESADALAGALDFGALGGQWSGGNDLSPLADMLGGAASILPGGDNTGDGSLDIYGSFYTITVQP